jgi:hypothetical protein
MPLSALQSKEFIRKNRGNCGSRERRNYNKCPVRRSGLIGSYLPRSGIVCARVIGKVTPKRVETVRKATKIVEEELGRTSALQYLAILHQGRVTGIRKGKRDFGLQIKV